MASVDGHERVSANCQTLVRGVEEGVAHSGGACLVLFASE
jgi:hypothetical protein